MTLSAKQSLFFRMLPWLIIAFGIVLRLDQYFFNRSLWLDEAFFANNVVNRTFFELLIPPLEYTGHIMPPGLLIMAKLMITLFGNSDLILRLFPLICGIIALVLFYQVAKIYISARAVPLALFFFAISDSLIYYSSEFKQYSNDVVVALILLILADYLRTSPLTFAKLLLLTLVGSLVLWFSHPAVFTLATIGIYLLFIHFSTKTWKPVINLSIVYAIWLLNFSVLYFFIIRIETPANQWLRQFWTLENAFMPFPLSIHGIHWLAENFLKMLNYPVGFNQVELAGTLLILGSVGVFAKNRLTLFLLGLPLLLVLGVSFFHQYPFSGRLLLFLTPSLYLLIAEGLTKIKIDLPACYSNWVETLTPIVLLAFLCGYPFIKDLNYWNTPRVIQETKPLFQYVQQHRQPADTLYLYYWMEPAFRYYANFYNFNYEDCHLISPIPTDQEYIKEVDYFRQKLSLTPMEVNKTQCVLGVAEVFARAQADLEKLRGKGRVWFLFSHLGTPERNLFLNYLDTQGTRLEEQLQPGASVYLYQLTK